MRILYKKGVIFIKNNSAIGGGVYGIAVLGALVYYLQHATTFLMGILGIFKAIFWPAFIIYKVLEMLKM
ncbi:MAG TPA: hypothetical protein VF189_03560 [Patescibacteria group bacterium]